MNTNTENTVIDGEIIEIKTPAAALAVMNPGQYGKELMEPYAKQLTAARRKVAREKFDITTKAGMATAKSLRKMFVTIRTDADEAKSNAKRPIDAAGKAILAEFKPIEDGAKAEEKKIADLIAAEEKRIEDEKQAAIAAERARIEAIEARLAHIREIPGKYARANAETLEIAINELLAKQLDPKLYDEFLDAAAQAMIDTVEGLRQLHAEAIEREARDAELARLRAEEAQRQAAAAETQRQQEAMLAQQKQMHAIMEIQGLAASLQSAGLHQDREHVEAAVARARAFDPGAFGAMSAMASLARDAALPLLEDMLAALPLQACPVAVEEAAQLVEQQLEANSQELIDQPADAASPVISDTAPIESASGEVVGKVVIVDTPRKVIPPAKRPDDFDIVKVVAEHFEVPAQEALGWIASVDVNKTRIALSIL